MTKPNYLKIGLLILIFFVISFFTNILGALNPSVSADFGLTKTMAAFLPFCFFIAYGVMSIPAGILLEKYKEKKMLLAAFLLSMLAFIVFTASPTFGASELSSSFCTIAGRRFELLTSLLDGRSICITIRAQCRRKIATCSRVSSTWPTAKLAR